MHKKVNYIQKRIYLESLSLEDTLIYNLSLYGEIPNNVDLIVLSKELESIFNKIDEIILTFYEIDGEIYFKRNNSNIKIEVIYLEKFNPKNFMTPINIRDDILYNIQIIITPSSQYIYMVFHHILVDEMGIDNILKILNNELIYKSLFDSNNHIEINDYMEEKKFWKNNIENLIKASKIPIKGESNITTYDSNIYILNIDIELQNALEELETKGFTQNLIKTYAYAKLLKLYTDNNYISFGMILNSRQYQDIDTIGIYANILPIIYEFKEKSLIKEIECFEESYYKICEVNYYSVINLFEQLPNFYKDNVIKSIFINQNHSNKYLKKFNITLHDIDIYEQVYDLVIENCINSIKFKYNNNFCLSQIKLLVNNYRKIIIDTNNNINNSINKLDIKIEKSLLEGLTVNYKDKLCEKFLQLNDNKIILEDSKKIFSKKDIIDFTFSVGNLLKDKNVSRVLIYLDRTIYLPLFVLSCILLNIEYVLLDKKLPYIRKRYILDNSIPDILIYDQIEFKTNCNKLSINEFIENKNMSKILINEGKSDKCFICYTSGSTGEPKAVQITRESLKNILHNANLFQSYNEDTRCISIANVSFDMFSAEIILTILNGGYVYIMNEDEQEINNFTKIIHSKNINTMFITPSRFNVYIKLNELHALKNIRIICFGGEDIKFNILDIKNILNKTKLYNLYGPTETTFYVMQKELLDNNVTLGGPICNTNVSLINEKLELVNLYETGEIYITGKNVSNGYLNYQSNKFMQFENTVGYRTGDYGKILESGELLYLGRKDKQIKVRGQRIDLTELEKLLLINNNLDDFDIVINNNELYLYVILLNEYKIEDLRNNILNSLPSSFMPKEIRIRSNPKLTLNGKLEEGVCSNIVNNIELNNKIKIIIATMEEVLLNSKAYNQDIHFNSIGGDSLKALEVASILQRKGLNISTFDIIKHQTPLNIANATNKHNATKNYTMKNIPIYNFFTTYNNISERFNMSMEIVFENSIGYDVEKTIMKWAKETSLLNYKFRFIENEIEIYNESNFSNFIFFNSVSNDLYEQTHNKISIKDNKLLAVSMYKKGGNYYCIIVVHHFLIDAVGLKNIYYEIIDISNDEKLNKKDNFIDYQIERKIENYNQFAIAKNYYLNKKDREFISFNNQEIFRYKKAICLPKREMLKISKDFNITVSDLILSLIVNVFTQYEEYLGKYISILLENQGHNYSFGWCTEIAILFSKLEINKLSTQIRNIKLELERLKIFGFEYLNVFNNKREKYLDTYNISYNYLADMFESNNNDIKISNFAIGNNFSDKISFNTAINISVISDKKYFIVEFTTKEVSKIFIDELCDKLLKQYNHLIFNFEKNEIFKLETFIGDLPNKIKLFNDKKILLPMTDTQKNILNGCIINNSIKTAEITMSYKIDGYIDICDFKNNLQNYIENNIYLALKVGIIDAINFFYLENEDILKVEYVEISSIDKIDDYIKMNSLKITNSLCIQFFIFKVENEFIFSINANHILIDGISIKYIIEDIFNNYLSIEKNYFTKVSMIDYIKAVYRIDSTYNREFWNNFIEHYELNKIIEPNNYEPNNYEPTIRKFEKISIDIPLKDLIVEYCNKYNITISNFSHSLYGLVRLITKNQSKSYYYAIDSGRMTNMLDISNSIGMFINRRLYCVLINNREIKIFDWIREFCDINLVNPQYLLCDINKLNIRHNNGLFGYEDFKQNETKEFKNDFKISLLNGSEGVVI